MNRLKNTGLVLCGLVLGLSLSAPAAQAVESLKATLSTNRILVDGQETHMTAYTIGGSNYVRLRDIGKAVGFEVYWDSENGCVQVESGKPYTGEEPAKDEVIKPAPQPEPAVPASDADVDAMKQEIVDRTNAIRREQGISALTVNAKLMQAAQVRAEEMAASGAYSHTRPDGRKNTTVTDCPYVGENIHRIADWALQGKSVSEVAVWSWNLSGGHRDNLLEKNYAETGVGLARGVNDNGDACSTLRSAPKTPSSVPCGRFCRLQRHPDTRYPRQRAWVFCAAQPAAANRCHPYWKQLCVCRQGLTRPRPYPAKRKPTISISAMKALTWTVCPVR